MDTASPVREFKGVAVLDTATNQAIVEASGILGTLTDYVVDSPESANMVNSELRNVKTRIKRLDDARKSIVKPLDEARAAAQAIFVPAIEALQKFETGLKERLLTWQTEQERARQEEIRRQEEEARKARERAEAEAAAIRAKAEAQARELEGQAAKAKAEAEAAQQRGDATAAANLLGKAASLETKAATTAEAAERKVTNGQLAAAPVAAPITPPPAALQGFSSRDKWEVELVDKMALIKAVADRPELAALLDVDLSAAKKMAGALKEAFNVPGLRAKKTQVAASRAA